MTEDHSGFGEHTSSEDDLIEIDLNFESMRRFQAEFSPNLSKDGLFIDTGEPLEPGSVVRFRVILPEEFVFLEGTAVVEWMRRVEAASDGVPGMALRFVTLSPQNQELVEQLVQDHVDAGGAGFDLDFRPAPEDFPTDALEGAPSRADKMVDEGYRLTVRRTGVDLQAEALQALAEAAPDAEDGVPSIATDVEDAEPEEPIGEPPALDWSDESEIPAEPEEEPGDSTTVPSDAVEEDIDLRVETQPKELEFLPTPVDFDEGPEVIEDVEIQDFGSPAFAVSLPEHDDEPDTTPVLPDEGRDDIRVPPEEGDEVTPRRRRLWPLGLTVVFLIALIGGFLWPHAKDWYATRNNQVTREPVAIDVADVVEESVVLGGEQPTAVLVEAQESSDEDAIEPMEAGDQDVAVAQIEPDGESGESTVEEMVEETQPETAVADVELAKADAVTAIDVEPGPGGTVIRIRGNGSLENGVISMEALPSPPRVLVRVRGITSSFRPYTIESSAPEVSRIRSGLHEERRPSELWIVVDLTGPEVVLGGINIRRDVAELVLARP